VQMIVAEALTQPVEGVAGPLLLVLLTLPHADIAMHAPSSSARMYAAEE